MKKHDADLLFKKMADEYIGVYGEELKKEAENMGGAAGEPDRGNEVVKRIRSRARSRASGIIGALAACAVLAVAIPVVYTQFMAVFGGGEPAQYAESAAAESYDAAAGESLPEATEETGQPGGGYGIIPLNAELPDNFTISAVEQDVGRTVYYLDEQNEDDVVMTLEYTEGRPKAVDGDMDAIMINGVEAYGKYKPDYSVLTFEKDGIEYVLTCKYDIDTLVRLGESILV